jgi:putative phosphoribosyl transferase
VVRAAESKLMLALPGAAPLFEDRREAGRLLGAELRDRWPGGDAVVIGLARGGVEVAAEVASALGAPLDVLAVRKVGLPWQPEYAIGAATPGDGVYLRSRGGLTRVEFEQAVAQAKRKAEALDARLRGKRPAVELRGVRAVLVDDGLATGATMFAAIRWARRRDARRVVVGVPVAAAQTVDLIRAQADEVVCLYELEDFGAVGLWYGDFTQVSDDEVVALLARAGRRLEPIT